MDKLPALHTVNWDSDTCECRVEVRRYHIYREPARFDRSGPVPRYIPEQVWCHLHQLDGTIEDIPMRVTTIEEMVKSGLQPDYWAESRRRQLEQIAKTEQLVREIAAKSTPLDRADPEWLARFGEQAETLPAPRDLAGWEGVLYAVRLGKTYADHEGYRRSPGTQTRGHLSHRCAKHHNQTSTSLQSQVGYYHCGCVIRQITVGERREFGVTHRQYVDLCPLHRGRLLAA